MLFHSGEECFKAALLSLKIITYRSVPSRIAVVDKVVHLYTARNTGLGTDMQ